MSSSSSKVGLMKKTRTFGSARSPSMETPAMQKPAEDREEEFFHFSHPYHPLVPMTLPYLFTCMGCKEYGAGKRFSCQFCDFELHDFCALAPPSLHGHPFGEKHQLIFLTKPGGFLRSSCNICGKPTKGYTFRCTTCNFEMHPCCTLLHAEMKFPVHLHTLEMSSSARSDHSTYYSCRICNRRRSGCVYRCAACEFRLHAVCAKNMANGLYVNGIRPPEKSNRFGNAAKVASHAFLGIIGGLIEGIGEGIGEALIDGIGRSRNISSNRNKQ